ncbi:DEAD/DEAH box helicase [Halieaceae bacterium IMCC8485]|uniref:ATP-dependent RNA helicase RhlE n=1 Tax=Candidatus Seongchinamella marina TaxID=2518990 RepID=A0ABT3SRQ4_9GAMM|nr:DEAD/DEAH box helicase [Candidatus Seongchinamella marina]MCX2972656.1 DEAD/DEAH box helicase [Candidatus Seongchinamella marina]
MTFDQLGLSSALLRAIEKKGYSEPSPIQAKAIPAVLSGKDVMAAAQTGTGKTAAFTLPILQRLNASAPIKPHRIRALILTPTRELAAQVAQSVSNYGLHMPLKSAVVFGGVKINPQIAQLRRGVDILIATPGRLLDLHGQGELDFGELEILVLDEADRMLDMGFIHDIRQILKLLPAERQNLLFSATFAAEIRELTKKFLQDPIEVEVASRNATADKVEQWVYPVDKKRKGALLRELVEEKCWTQVLVFSRTKHGANRLAQQLVKAGIEATAIHGNKSQGARTRALEDFKSGSLRVLVATDIAARGLDIAQLPQVVNFDLPNVAQDYVHRIGRTGRAGASGKAYSLVSADEIKQLNDIEQLIQRHLPREYIDGFEPEHEVPASAPLRKPRQPGRRPPKHSGGGSNAGKHTAKGRAGEGHKRPRRRRPRAGSGNRA